jgi:phosphoribulokinase
MLDKGRAKLVGKNGEYHFACPLDQQVLDFVGLDSAAVKAELAAGKGDGEILEWINANAKHKRTPWEIAQWTAWRETAAPTDVETREFFNGLHKAVGEKREDIATWADLLDLDDYVTFGGKA